MALDYHTYRAELEPLPEFGVLAPLAESVGARVLVVIQIRNPTRLGIITVDYGSRYAYADVPKCLPAETAGMEVTLEEFRFRPAKEFWHMPSQVEVLRWSMPEDNDGKELLLRLFGVVDQPALTATIVLGPPRYSEVVQLTQTTDDVIVKCGACGFGDAERLVNCVGSGLWFCNTQRASARRSCILKHLEEQKGAPKCGCTSQQLRTAGSVTG